MDNRCNCANCRRARRAQASPVDTSFDGWVVLRDLVDELLNGDAPGEALSALRRMVDDYAFDEAGEALVRAPGAVEAVEPPRPLFYLSPSGRRFDQSMAHELAELDGFSLLCGRYEGVDERVREHLCDGEISVGDVVLAGGEVAAAMIIEAVGRLVPGVLGNATSVEDESFADGLLEYPHYTRPAEFRGWGSPDVLRSGDHGKVARWRLAKAIERTAHNRPDLLDARGGLSDDEQRALDEFGIALPER